MMNGDESSSASSSNNSNTVTAASGKRVEIPDEFICPITLNLMEYPIVNRYGHCYERDAVIGWFAHSGTCPLTRRDAKVSDFVPNSSLRTAIQTFRIKHGIMGPVALVSDDIALVSDDSDNSDSSMEENDHTIKPMLLLPSMALNFSRDRARNSRLLRSRTFATTRPAGSTADSNDAVTRRARAEYSRRLLSETLEAALLEVGTDVL